MDMIKTTKKMRGFMCQSPAATAVCTTDRRLVIVPRRADRTLHHSTLLSNNLAKYSRLKLVDESTRHSPAPNRRAAPTPHHKSSSQTPTVDHVFQGHTWIVGCGLVNPATQVVVMKVSLHCQGCAGKVKKHLSKMEGVTSFSIDLETKRVIVMGHVSPVGVLESISKVKRAELWTC